MQDYYDRQIFKETVNATELSFVGTIGFAFCGLMGPVTPFFMSLVGARWLLFFGTLLISAGLVLASYSTQVWQLYITQSVMHGMGAAFLYIVREIQILKVKVKVTCTLRYRYPFHHNGLSKDEVLPWESWRVVQVLVV